MFATYFVFSKYSKIMPLSSNTQSHGGVLIISKNKLNLQIKTYFYSLHVASYFSLGSQVYIFLQERSPYERWGKQKVRTAD